MKVGVQASACPVAQQLPDMLKRELQPKPLANSVLIFTPLTESDIDSIHRLPSLVACCNNKFRAVT